MENEINLSKFLSRYANLKGANLKKLTHDDVKILFPFLKRTTFQYVDKNRDLLRKGKVVLVNDGFKTIPYFATTLPNQLEEESDVFLKEEKNKRVNHKAYDYTSMSEYELRCLLRAQFNTYKNRRNAKKELEKRGIVLRKKYKRSDEKLILKGEMNND